MVAGCSGECDREIFDALLNPGYLKDGEEVRANKTLAANAVGAATSLGLVEAGRDKATLTAGRNLVDASDFADYVHDHLSSLKSGETDSAILDAYAWLAAESHRQGQLEWIYDLGREEFADKANAALVGEEDDGRLMNTTKVVAWRRWLAFLGLGVALPLPNTPDFPTTGGERPRWFQHSRLITSHHRCVEPRTNEALTPQKVEGGSP